MARALEVGSVRGYNHAMGMRGMFLLLVLIPLGIGWSSPLGAKDAEPLSLAEIRKLVEDLRDDDVRWNAKRAAGKLAREGVRAASLLEHALDSDDYQQRHFAARILQRILEELNQRPSERLIEVSIEALADDHVHGMKSVDNARGARHFLLQHVEQARDRLLKTVRESKDRQQRFFAAWILVVTGVQVGLEDTSAVLIEHLADNDVMSDACISCWALFHAGEAVLPYLRPHLKSEDRQQREAIELLLLDFEDPPQTREELLERMELHSLSRHHPDPCIDAGRQWFEDLGDNPLKMRFYGIWRKKSNVPSLERLFKKHGGRRSFNLSWKIDRLESDHIVIAAGLLGPRFDRRLTLRIWENGAVDRCEGHWPDNFHWVEELAEPTAADDEASTQSEAPSTSE